MKKFINSLLVLMITYPLLSIIVSSCAEESDCSMMGRPMVWCGFYTIDENNNRVASVLDSLTITAFNTDSVILNNQKEVQHVSLPLRYLNDSTIFVFHYNTTSRDTILVQHTNTPYFVSMDCGYEVRQTIVGNPHGTSTRHRLDSIYLTNNLNTNTNGTENMQIFY